MREVHFGESRAFTPHPIRPSATFPGEPGKALDMALLANIRIPGALSDAALPRLAGKVAEGRMGCGEPAHN